MGFPMLTLSSPPPKGPLEPVQELLLQVRAGDLMALLSRPRSEAEETDTSLKEGSTSQQRDSEAEEEAVLPEITEKDAST